jgi:uncharacterized protein DUF6883
MPLPEASLATIDRRKITDYLLAASHPAGRAKAGFFLRFGFTTASWKVLQDALLQHAAASAVAVDIDTPFGKKYILDGPLPAPDGRRPRVRAIWFVAAGERVPRFVTAYPAPGAD